MGIRPPRSRAAILWESILSFLLLPALAAVDGPHVQGMAKDKGNVLVVAEIGEPVPGEHASRTDDIVFSERLNEPEKDFRPGSDIQVQIDDTLAI